MSKEVKRVNMNGSSDPYYRYTMPMIQLKVEGTTKMIKSVLTNIAEVCQAVGRPPDYLITFLGQELSANSKIDKDTEKAYVTGAMDERQVQQIVFKFINETVSCGNCGNPETTIHIEGSKKNKFLYLTCKGCGQRTDKNSAERFVKYMILHPPDEEGGYGHAKTAAGSVGDAMATATAMDEERKKKKKDKKEGDEEDDGKEKKDKKDKKKKKDKEKDGDSDGDDDKKEKKKKKKKDKEGESDEEGEKKDGEKKKEKKASKKDKKEKDKDSGNDSWEDDWGEDTTEAAVAEREKMMGGKSQEEEDRLAKKMEDMLKVAEAKDAAGPQKEEKEQEESEDEDDKKAPAPAKEESDDDLDIDDI